MLKGKYIRVNDHMVRLNAAQVRLFNNVMYPSYWDIKITELHKIHVTHIWVFERRCTKLYRLFHEIN